MSDQNSLFTTNNIPQETPAPQATSNVANAPQNDALATLLSQIRNERGEQKYRTVEEALNGLKHAQEFIPQLTTKQRQLEQELEDARRAAAKVAEIENTVKSLTQQVSSPPATQGPAITPEQVAELIDVTLQRKQAETSAQANTKAVTAAVLAKFGDKAEQVFYGKAEELGLSKAEFNALAAKTPKAVLNLLGITDTAVTPQQVKSSSQSVINTTALEPPSETLIGRNKVPTLVGATTQQLREESLRARQMVDELHGKGLTVHDLTDPKVYFKHFS